MISYIRGELAGLERDKAIVDVQGVGYGLSLIHISEPTRH